MFGVSLRHLGSLGDVGDAWGQLELLEMFGVS